MLAWKGPSPIELWQTFKMTMTQACASTRKHLNS